MKPKFTSPPWEAGRDAEGEVAVVTYQGRDICTVEKYYGDHEENTRLIADAPTMYAALEEYIAEWMADHRDDDHTTGYTPYPQSLEMALACLRRVKGEE